MSPFDEALRSAIRAAVVEQLGKGSATPGQIDALRRALTSVLEQAIPQEGDAVEDIALRATIAAHLDAVFSELGYSR